MFMDWRFLTFQMANLNVIEIIDPKRGNNRIKNPAKVSITAFSIFFKCFRGGLDYEVWVNNDQIDLYTVDHSIVYIYPFPYK